MFSEKSQKILQDLSGRALEVMRGIVLSYMQDGAPVGSKVLSRLPGIGVSAATIRSIMSELEALGYLHSPHISAGRVPTESGLRLFVDGLMQTGELTSDERGHIEELCNQRGHAFDDLLRQTSLAMSDLSGYASLVVAPKSTAPLKHIEFIPLSDNRALAILVTEDGHVENRALSVPLGTPMGALITASNYLNAKLAGRSISEATEAIKNELAQDRNELDQITERLIEDGLAFGDIKGQEGHLIVRGQSNLLEGIEAGEDLVRVKQLLAKLESRETYLRLMEAADGAQGIKIFIGSQTELFGLSGCSMVLKPYRSTDEQVIGAVGVIGPMRLNYGKVIPMVDYTADVMSRILG